MKRHSNVTLRIPQATEKGYIECPVWGCFDGSYPNSQLRRGRVQEGGPFLQQLHVMEMPYMLLSQRKPINGDSDGLSRAVRHCYGKCGFDSIFRQTGHGITGICEIYETL